MLAGRVGVSLVPEDIVRKLVTTAGALLLQKSTACSPWYWPPGSALPQVAARPMFYPVRRPAPMALLVMVGWRRWLVDLGFGSYGIARPCAQPTPMDVPQDLSLTQPQSGEMGAACWRDRSLGTQCGFDLWPQGGWTLPP